MQDYCERDVEVTYKLYELIKQTNYSKDMARILTNKKLGERIARMKLPLTLDDFQKWRITHDQKKRRSISVLGRSHRL